MVRYFFPFLINSNLIFKFKFWNIFLNLSLTLTQKAKCRITISTVSRTTHLITLLTNLIFTCNNNHKWTTFATQTFNLKTFVVSNSNSKLSNKMLANFKFKIKICSLSFKDRRTICNSNNHHLSNNSLNRTLLLTLINNLSLTCKCHPTFLMRQLNIKRLMMKKMIILMKTILKLKMKNSSMEQITQLMMRKDYLKVVFLKLMHYKNYNRKPNNSLMLMNIWDSENR